MSIFEIVRSYSGAQFLPGVDARTDRLNPLRFACGVDSASVNFPAVADRDPAYLASQGATTPGHDADLSTGEWVKGAVDPSTTEISIVNYIAEVCEAAFANVTHLTVAAVFDDQISRNFLHAGIGCGASCPPEDIGVSTAAAGELGANQALACLREVDAGHALRRTLVLEGTR